MLHAGNKRQFRAGNQFSQTSRCPYRRTTAPVHVIVCTTKDQRWYFDLRRLRQSVPCESRFFVKTKLFNRGLSRPQSGSKSCGQVAVFAIKGRVKRHAIVVYVSLYITLKSHFM